MLFVWDTFIAPSSVSSIYLLTHGNGSSLAVDIVHCLCSIVVFIPPNLALSGAAAVGSLCQESWRNIANTRDRMH